jgi:hypothetical protein
MRLLHAMLLAWFADGPVAISRAAARWLPASAGSHSPMAWRIAGRAEEIQLQ